MHFDNTNQPCDVRLVQAARGEGAEEGPYALQLRRILYIWYSRTTL